jgi:hypothetical protein
MMRKRINIDFSSMAGLGPKAWDRDESRVAMHTAHPHRSKKHHSKTHRPLPDALKEDAKRDHSER